ncbi:pimeloyl-ACP methyl ester carboxylesterase [Luteibacter sp. Sphag1AF]|uniref:alpha/beta fold hydrolase n=1 Tax=Luteibacter sp. Sphag1AF TaxID=2587031 RepID=UPI00161DFCB5|nr:alpha/beta fold hydrolase [Luteibacter sp. Sphag1AF]MBB3228568.1 pimeloyl-ACP methyl ester carboxylesterase [Luteibacter sp. Sphag1AF]
MHEEAFRFGRASHLVGVAGLPPTGVRETTGVVLLNAGLVHHVGPFRLHVELTRALNTLGYPTLRFDLSTIGDSGSSGESQTRHQQICADVDDAMNLLAHEAGCSRFVLVGLCSGAQNAHVVACTDPRVAGAVFMDGYAYRTLGFKVRHYLPRLMKPASLLRRLTRRRAAKGVPGAQAQPVFAVAASPRAVVRADFTGMVERGMRLCLIYSGGISNFFNHPRQFRECFGAVMRSPEVTTFFVRESDHTYVLTPDRQRLIERIGQWLSLNFPVQRAGSTS